MIETPAEKLANAKMKIEMGIADKVKVLSEIEGISTDEAEKIIEEMAMRKQASIQLMQGIQMNDKKDNSQDNQQQDQQLNVDSEEENN